MQSRAFQEYPVIVSRTDRIGDLVLSLPVLGYLKTAGFKNVFLRVAKYTQDIAQLALFNDLCKDIIIEGEEVEFAKKHKIEKSLGLYLVHRSGQQLATEELKISFAVGPRTHLSSLWKFHKTLRQKRSQALKSECRYNLELAEFFVRQFAPSSPSTRLGLQALKIPENYSTQIQSPDLVIILNNRGSAENLRVGKYLELCAPELQKFHKVDFLVSGQDANDTERELVSELGSKWDPLRFRIIKDFPNLKQLTAYLGHSKKVCASSTGPLHLAHALGVSVRGFYPGPHTAAKSQSFSRWRPDGYWHQAAVEYDEF